MNEEEPRDLVRQPIRYHIFLLVLCRRVDNPSSLELLKQPFFEAHAAVTSTVGAHLHTEAPFDTTCGTGDHRSKVTPAETRSGGLAPSHRGSGTGRLQSDPGSITPFDRLLEGKADGIINCVSNRASI